MKDSQNLPDIQNSESCISLAIQRVGITDLKIPIYISEKGGGVQHSVAEVDVFVDLDKCSKGTHMSRLTIGVQKFMDQQLNAELLLNIAEYIRLKLDTRTAQVIYKFPYFIKKNAPVSKEPGLVYHNITFDLTHNYDQKNKFIMGIETTATSLCPCSKEISNSSAHNQRSKIKLTVVPNKNAFIWIEDLINTIQNCASCEVYSALKRIDEKHVTELAYSRPKFVEDIVREIYQILKDRNDIAEFIVEVKNEESIHQHNAYAKMISD